MILLDIKRKRKNKNMITTQQLLDEMHLDVSETAQIENLLSFAMNYVVSTCAKNATAEDVVTKTNEKIFEQAVKSIVSSLYFEEPELGWSLRSQILLNSVRNMYQGA